MWNIRSHFASAASCGLTRANLSYNYLIKHLRKRWGIDIGILDFGTRWRCMSILAAFVQEDFHRNSLDTGLGRLQPQSGFYSKEKNVLLLPVTEPRFFGYAALSSVTTATDRTVCHVSVSPYAKLVILTPVGHSNSSIRLYFHICFWETASLKCYNAWRHSSDLQHVCLHLKICIVRCAIRVQLQESFRNILRLRIRASWKLYQ
jgi:hypothetical protein